MVKVIPIILISLVILLNGCTGMDSTVKQEDSPSSQAAEAAPEETGGKNEAELARIKNNEVIVRDVLVNNIWQFDEEGYDYDSRGHDLVKFFENGDMIYIMTNEHAPRIDFVIISKYTITDNEVYFQANLYYKGKLNADNIIYGKEGNRNTIDTSRDKKFKILTDESLINRYADVLLFNPLTVLPKGYEGGLEGPLSSEVEIVNTFDFYVAAAIQNDRYSEYVIINPKGGSISRLLKNGKYQMYYVYYNDKDSLYKGEDLTVLNQSAKITLRYVSGGNYNIEKVK